MNNNNYKLIIIIIKNTHTGNRTRGNSLEGNHVTITPCMSMG